MVTMMGTLQSAQIGVVVCLARFLLLLSTLPVLDSISRALAQTVRPQQYQQYQQFLNSQFNQNPFVSALRDIQSNGPAQPSPHDAATPGEPLPWDCQCEMHWRDLGARFYPRYIKDGRCSSSQCWYGHFTCVPTKYTFPVLRRLLPGDEVLPSDYAVSDDVVLQTVEVTSACQCGR